MACHRSCLVRYDFASRSSIRTSLSFLVLERLPTPLPTTNYCLLAASTIAPNLYNTGKAEFLSVADEVTISQKITTFLATLCTE